MKFLIAAGGTGGHINPAIAVAEELRARYPDAKILFVGTKKKMEAKLVPDAGFDFRSIDITGFQRKLTPKNILANVKTAYLTVKASGEAGKIIRSFAPDVAIGFGGYVSGPVIRKAHKLGVKTVIHEQNAYPGVANKALAKQVDRVLLTSPEAEKYLECKNEPVVTGLPVRASVLNADRAAAREKLGVGNRILVFSTGGSLGAKTINNVMLGIMIAYRDVPGIRFIHGYGRYGAFVPEKLAAAGIDEMNERYDVREYIYDMDDCLAAADIVISRAGASSVAEIEALGKAAILIPSPNVAENHQYHNAMALVKNDAAMIVEEKELTQNPDAVKEALEELLSDPQRVIAIGKNAKRMALNDAKSKICDVILSLTEA
ncbi:MAG: undecaprenyldiphospho-muramoylpentapeptide beta-N-acetylglucosaminyltransferase [Clostridia bacterium]|nr:undecaprenyldiphospho-muramoylpentapeptide beta-N-acetylglucosaminyltransferase [Clostridia bacterium]